MVILHYIDCVDMINTTNKKSINKMNYEEQQEKIEVAAKALKSEQYDKKIFQYKPIFTPSRCGEEYFIAGFNCYGSPLEKYATEISKISEIIKASGLEIEEVHAVRNRVG